MEKDSDVPKEMMEHSPDPWFVNNHLISIGHLSSHKPPLWMSIGYISRLQQSLAASRIFLLQKMIPIKLMISLEILKTFFLPQRET